MNVYNQVLSGFGEFEAMAAVKEFRHQIYTGAFEALELKWKETTAELQRDDPLAEVAALVGSNILSSYLRRLSADAGLPAANIRFYTFLDLLRHIVAARRDRPGLPSMGSAVLLESLLEDRINLPKTYAPLAGYKGFRDALLGTFRDLRDADIAPDDLERAIDAGRRALDRRERLESFANLYRRYRKEVCRFRDTDDDFRDAIEKLSGGQRAEGGEAAPLLVYGIYDATGQQAGLLDALSRTRPMIYFIPFVDAAVSEFARPFLDARASNLCVDPLHLDSPAKPGSLGRLAEKHFGLSRGRTRGGALKDDGSFALVSAPGESRAAVEVVREIFRAVRDGVISGFHEAAVILRQPESDIPVLSEAMRLRKMPYYIHGGEKFYVRPVCKAVLAMSGLETANFSRGAILDAVEFIGAALQENETENWDVENWRAETREAESLTGVRSWDSSTRNILRRAAGAVRQLEQTPETDEEKLTVARERLAGARRLRQDWRILQRAAAGWPERLSFTEWSKFLRRRFGKILKASPEWPYILSALDKIADLETLAKVAPVSGVWTFQDVEKYSNGRAGGVSRFAAPGGNREAALTRRYDVYNSAPRRGANRVMENAMAAHTQIRSLLDEAVQSIRYPAGRFQRSGVNLLGVSAARGLRFPLVVVPGLDEGRFPSRLRQDPLLPDSERRRFAGLPLRGARAVEEKLLFDMAARSAEKRLVLVTSRLDESADREKFPSLFFLRAASAVSGGRIAPDGFSAENIPGFRSVGLDAAAPERGIAAADEGEIRLRWIASGGRNTARALAELALAEPLRLRQPLEYERARSNDRLTKYDGMISDPRLIQWTRQKLDTDSGRMSASRFEEYARCPYFFFLMRVMNLRVQEDDRGITESMDPLERGTAVHAALESFLKNHAGENLASASEELLHAALEAEARSALEKKRPAGMPGMLWEIERDGLLILLQNWLKFEIARSVDDMRIARLEQAFGNFSEFPPFRPESGISNFEFSGRIDRVDVSADGKRARLVDYKIGKLPDALRKKDRPFLMGGEKIQLAVYRGALAALDEFAAVEAVEAEYLYLQPRDGEVRKSALDTEQMEATFNDLPRVLDVVDSCMKNGLFFARTHSLVYPYGHCNYCEFLPVCGKDRAQREKRKNADPMIQGFLALARQ